LIQRSKGQRSRSHGYENRHGRAVANDHVPYFAYQYAAVILAAVCRRGSACRYDCLCFLVDLLIGLCEFCCRQKQELYRTPAAKDVTPLSGYLNFTYGINRQPITIMSVDNSLPQPNRLFSVRLVSSSGWTPVSDTRLAVATITGQSCPVCFVVDWNFYSLRNLMLAVVLNVTLRICSLPSDFIGSDQSY